MCYERQSKLDRQRRREFNLILAAIVRHQEQPDFDPTERFYRPERLANAPFFDWRPETLYEMVERVSLDSPCRESEGRELRA